MQKINFVIFHRYQKGASLFSFLLIELSKYVSKSKFGFTIEDLVSLEAKYRPTITKAANSFKLSKNNNNIKLSKIVSNCDTFFRY